MRTLWLLPRPAPGTVLALGLFLLGAERLASESNLSAEATSFTGRAAIQAGPVMAEGPQVAPATTGLMADGRGRLVWVARRLENIALGCPSSYDVGPNYILGAAPNEQIGLTPLTFTSGGRYAIDGKMVGWQDAGCVSITVDLGSVQAIGGVAFATAAGKGGVLWPKAIGVLVSDDGKNYSQVADLVDLDRVHEPPPAGTFALHRYWTDGLRTHGRWVMWVVTPDGPCVVADEIEVFRGEPECLGLPLPEPRFAGGKDFRLATAVSRRFNDDQLTVRNATGVAMLPYRKRAELLAGLDAIERELPAEFHPRDLSSFRAVLPLDPLHARIFGAQAALWRALTRPALTLTPANPWDPVPYLPADPPPGGGTVAVAMMENEHRAAAFNLCNAGTEAALVRVRITGLPGGDNPPWVSVAEAIWTDTWAGEPVASALAPARRDGLDYVISVPPGLIRQVWLDFHPVDAPPGEYRGRVAATAGGPELSLPVELKLYPLRFPDQPTLHLGGWDFTDADANGGITPENRDAVIGFLRDHGVDSPWARGSVLPANRDTAQFDRWLARWPGARQYCVYAPTGDSFDGAAMGTPEFDRKVGDWIRFWAGHAVERGLKPGQLVLALVDEPRGGKQDAMIVVWARAIRAAATGVKIWEDPVHPDPAAANQEMMGLCDVLCPNRPMFLAGDQAFRNYYQNRQLGGQELAFYSCSGPAHALDPYSYFRLQAWTCWQTGAQSSYYWSFGSAESCWNEYLLPQAGSYLPFFLDDTTVTTSRALEAIRESVEDYEYLRMLRDATNGAAERGTAPVEVARARRLLAGAADAVLLAPGAQNPAWNTPKDRGIADQQRAEILDALGVLAAQN